MIHLVLDGVGVRMSVRRAGGLLERKEKATRITAPEELTATKAVGVARDSPIPESQRQTLKAECRLEDTEVYRGLGR